MQVCAHRILQVSEPPVKASCVSSEFQMECKQWMFCALKEGMRKW